MENERCEVQYTGRVQGVGFRYTVREIASQFAIAGFVRNRPDGSVELVVEGTRQQIGGLLDDVKMTMGRYIRDAREQWRPATGEFHDFRVRY